MRREDILQRLHREGEELEIPDTVAPGSIEEKLKAQIRDGRGKGRRGLRKMWLYPAAACLFFAVGVLGGGAYLASSGSGTFARENFRLTYAAGEEIKNIPLPQERDLLEVPDVTYEEIYAKLSDTWEQEEILFQDAQKQYARGNVMEAATDEVKYTMMSELSDSAAEKTEGEAFGKTNIQVEQVDEADRVKNDGRYLYQVIQRKPKEGGAEEEVQGIQILDTEGGLREIAFVDGFGNLGNFYVWEDYLITIENKYEDAGDDYVYSSSRFGEDLYYKQGNALSWHEITFYDIADREKPRRKKTFTFRGNCESSRIADGYLYGISSFRAQPGEGEEDYSAYIPTVDGETIPADRIYCPAGYEGTDYLVLISIDLSNPDTVADSRAILFGNGIYYVSRKNIYMTDYESVYNSEPEHEGIVTDRTKILKFSYIRGEFFAQAEGEIPGQLNDNFSLDEYGGCLRAVTTVQTCYAKKIVDDRTGEMLGYNFEDVKQTNALYVLGSRLLPKGKIEGLAEGEQIYSARFLGDTGYFVTFRQIDPLFAVDLSNPESPEVIGELKVSGFSEYLHFYGENLLLGIGMEADEETGRTEGMKLSMFDLSDPAQLKEVSKRNLEDYNYSEALWDYHTVLIDTEENLIGFPAEGSNRGEYWNDYLVFSYENGSFVQKFKFKGGDDEGRYYRIRGTFIGRVFYLLREDGNVRAYDRENGRMLEETG